MDAVRSMSTIRNFMGNAGRNTCNEYLYEALQDADEALQKQIPKKPQIGADFFLGHDDDGNPIWETDYICSECEMGLAREYVCCPYCGQAINWN